MQKLDDTCPNPDPLYDLHQAAAYLATSDKHVRRLIAAGRLAGTQLGPRKLRVRRSELERFVHESTSVAR